MLLAEKYNFFAESATLVNNADACVLCPGICLRLVSKLLETQTSGETELPRCVLLWNICSSNTAVFYFQFSNFRWTFSSLFSDVRARDDPGLRCPCAGLVQFVAQQPSDYLFVWGVNFWFSFPCLVVSITFQTSLYSQRVNTCYQ